MRRPRQHSQHISSLNCCSRPSAGYDGPRHSTILSTSWLSLPSSFKSNRSYSIRKQFSSENGSCPFAEICLRSIRLSATTFDDCVDKPWWRWSIWVLAPVPAGLPTVYIYMLIRLFTSMCCWLGYDAVVGPWLLWPNNDILFDAVAEDESMLQLWWCCCIVDCVPLPPVRISYCYDEPS